MFNCVKNTQGAIIEVPPELYEHISNKNVIVSIGYQCHKSYNDINIALGYVSVLRIAQDSVIMGKNVKIHLNVYFELGVIWQRIVVILINCNVQSASTAIKYRGHHDTEHMVCDSQSCEF